jgi:hypothetical protein
MKMTKKILAGGAAAAMSFGVMGGLAEAQPTQEGLVNVLVDGVNVQIPIGVAANVCGVAVNVLATAENFGDVDCDSEVIVIAEGNDRNGNGGNGNGGNGNGRQGDQSGLVNVAITDVNVQVPVAVAANICGVAVNVLAQAEDFGEVTCTSQAISIANR